MLGQKFIYKSSSRIKEVSVEESFWLVYNKKRVCDFQHIVQTCLGLKVLDYTYRRNSQISQLISKVISSRYGRPRRNQQEILRYMTKRNPVTTCLTLDYRGGTEDFIQSKRDFKTLIFKIAQVQVNKKKKWV